jgi:hypothetical protein
MAASEDQPQIVVVLCRDAALRGVTFERQQLRVFERRFEAAGAPQSIDGLVLRGVDQPSARMLRGALGRPLLERRGEGFLHGFFGQGEVSAQDANQSRRDGRRFAAVDLVELRNGERLLAAGSA